MEEPNSILHELYVYSEWKPEPEYIQKPDGLFPENLSALWRWMRFLGPKKSLIDSVTAHQERQQKWHIALGDEGKVIAVLTDNILEIRTKRSDYATIAARTTVSRDAYPQWRKLVWSPDCAFLVLAYGNGVVSFFDLTASNLFNIPIDCSRPGGLECTDNTHAVADIIFMPLRVKDTKWSWEVLIVNYDGKVRGYLVSVMDGFTLHHTTTFSGGVSCVVYCDQHFTLYVAGVPRNDHKDKESAHSAGITAWRTLNDEPHYKLSVVSDQLEGQANDKFQLYIPFVSAKNLAFVVQISLSPDGTKLVCLHCNGDISVWRLPLLKLMHRFPLATQPGHDLTNHLVAEEKVSKKDITQFFAADVNWWSNEEVILSRFSGSVSVCSSSELTNLLGRAEFLQGAPRVSRAHDSAFLALECETSVLPARRSDSDESMEVVKVEEDVDDNVFEVAKELFKHLLYAITDMETFQPKPRRITCVSRVYRLLAVKSTTPSELFARKIEAGSYAEALTLAETFHLDSDLVYQQQWRRNPVSTEAIQKYLSKVSKKIWAVHQCVDRLPETLSAARELLSFGLQSTQEHILDEINKDRPLNEQIADPNDILPEHLNAYKSELLRCRHVMLFYKERLCLYESILKFEKSTYQKDEYDRLRSNSIIRSSIEIAKEGRIEALTCLWPHIKTTAMKLGVLEKLPETVNPMEYRHLVPMGQGSLQPGAALPVPEPSLERDWCQAHIFRSIWSSNWSEETTPDSELACDITDATDYIVKWYERRAREIEERSGLASYALHLIVLADTGGVAGLSTIKFNLETLNSLIYDVNVEDVTLKDVEKWSLLETCAAFMKLTTPETFVSDLQDHMIPYLQRYEKFKKLKHMFFDIVCDYLESISEGDLAPILLLLRSDRYRMDVRNHLNMAERSLFAYDGTEQLDIACDILNTILRKSDYSIGESELLERVLHLEQLVSGSSKLSQRGLSVSPRVLQATIFNANDAVALLTRLARSLAVDNYKPTQADWEKLLKDILELQSTLFDCVTKEQCYEIYTSALLTSGDLASIKLASGMLASGAGVRTACVPYARSLHLVSAAAREYFNSASSLQDPALKLAECCLTLIKEKNREIQEELDLIAALQILHTFDINLLPVQVRLCENKMTLIEDCLRKDHVVYTKSERLLKLAALLRINGDDEAAREADVLQQVCKHAMYAGDVGSNASVSAARRLAALRATKAASLLGYVATHASAHADADTRRDLYAAAATYCSPREIEDMIRARLYLETDRYQRIASSLEHSMPSILIPAERWPSTDDEFADAVTTPVIENIDPTVTYCKKKSTPLIKYLLHSLQTKLTSDQSNYTTFDMTDRQVHVQEFYASLYPEHATSDKYYRYSRFSVPDVIDGDGRKPVSHDLLNWFYIQNCLVAGYSEEIECEALQKCAEELLHKDSALSVACLLRVTQDREWMSRFIETNYNDTALSAALYATLIQCNYDELGDSVFRAQPRALAETTLAKQNGTEEQMGIINECIARLSGMAESYSLRSLGFNIDSLLFNGDSNYRLQVIYMVARSPEKEHLDVALSLATKYSVDLLEVWLQHAVSALDKPHLTVDTMPVCEDIDHAHQRILETLYPKIAGNDHSALIILFNLLKGVDEKPLIAGLTTVQHIKLLKKAKAASSELNYKLLLEQPSVEEFTTHMLDILKPETVGMVAKFLRALPASIRSPVPVNVIFTKWLTKYFFSVPLTQASNKKWMQQYRQCASYFNKLSKDELMQFVRDTCFSDEALKQVQPNTRMVMITQAVDYCQQEHENEFKINKSEQSWSQVGAELARWARFLETFHSSTVKYIIDNSILPRNEEIWKEIEKSHGELEVIVPMLARLVVECSMRYTVMQSLLQCLRVETDHSAVFRHLTDHWVQSHEDMERLVFHLNQYHKDGAKFPEPLIEYILQRASALGLPPHKQISLLALSSRPRIAESEDIGKVAQFSVDLFRAEWPDVPYVRMLTEESLTTEAGRRVAFQHVSAASDTLHRRKALLDVLACWPPIREGESVSLHCEFLQSLLQHQEEGEHETLVYIKMLLQRPLPLLTEHELKLVIESAPPTSIINVMWVMLLNKTETTTEDIVKLVNDNQDILQTIETEGSFIKQLLDNQMLIPLVPTVLYQNIVDYIIGQMPRDQKPENVYDIRWATSELIKSKYYAEAGHMYLLTAGTPVQLRGFSEAVLYSTNTNLFHL